MSKRYFNRPQKPRGDVQRPNFPGIQQPGKYGDKSIEGIEKLVGDLHIKGFKDLGNGLFDFSKPGGGHAGDPPVLPPSGDGNGSNPPLGGQGSWPTGPSSSPLAINDLLKDLQFGSNQEFLNQGRDGGTYGAGYWDMLNNIGYGDQMSKWLESIGYKAGGKLTDEQAADWNKQLLDQYIQYITKLEERNYAQGQLNDQRLYDSPSNMLARLMGAGISRDAAIQMISGSGGSGGSANPLMSLGSMGVAPGINPSESYLNGVQAKTAIANTVFNGLGSLIGLTSLGFSIPQALFQTKNLQYQDFLNQEQKTAYLNAGKAFKILDAAGAGADAFGSVSNVIASLANLGKSGNADALSFIASGGADNLRLNSPFASKVLNGMYHSERESEDYSRSMDNYFRMQDLQKSMMELDVDKAHYQLESMFKSLFQQDADLERTYQAIRKGEIEIKIGKQSLRGMTFQNDIDQVYHDAYLEAVNTIPPGETQTGYDMLSESIWREMFGHWRKLTVEQSPDNLAAYEQFLQNNFDAACAMATIKAATSKQLADIWSSDQNNGATTWSRFTNIFFGTNTDKLIQLGEGAAQIGATLYLGKHNKNFID